MKDAILVVDDEEINRDLLQHILAKEYEIDLAEDGDFALEKLKEKEGKYAAILLDLQMPKMDGFSVLDEMKKQNYIDKIPVLVISGDTSVEVENKCFKMGVSDFIHKPFEPRLIQRRVRNMVDLFFYKNSLEEKVEKQTNTLKKQNKLLKFQAEKLSQMNNKIIDILGTVVEYRDLESGDHINRVKNYTEILARHAMRLYPEYGLTEERINMIVAASPLHDIGKIAIPDSILLKPGRLTDAEFECMKTHTTKGCELLSRIRGVWDDDYRHTVYDICRYHHEKYDGRGYPDGLKGEEIPLSAQLVSIADVYDALVSKRIYKSAFAVDEAFSMIINGECGEFSPKLLECFKQARPEFEKLVTAGVSEDTDSVS